MSDYLKNINITVQQTLCEEGPGYGKSTQIPFQIKTIFSCFKRPKCIRFNHLGVKMYFLNKFHIVNHVLSGNPRLKGFESLQNEFQNPKNCNYIYI